MFPTCNGCGDPIPLESYTVDHIHPRCRGGTDDPDNLWDMCRSCNSSKQHRTMREWLTVAKFKVVEFWRSRTPPVGIWSSDPNYYGTRRLISVRYISGGHYEDLFVRFKSGKTGVAYRADLRNFPRVEHIKVHILGNKKFIYVKPEDLIEKIPLKKLFVFEKPIRENFPYRRGDRIKILVGPYEGRYGTVEFITPKKEIYITTRDEPKCRLYLYKDDIVKLDTR